MPEPQEHEDRLDDLDTRVESLEKQTKDIGSTSARAKFLQRAIAALANDPNLAPATKKAIEGVLEDLG